ncbi:MAG: isoprenylcysteine carboxylmethyltransferase family protein [Lewinellaceae bacterium]|nr:isoprenylcysteine carboxylmethyltransferase family protein [Lewinellaceae bacterium]
MTVPGPVTTFLLWSAYFALHSLLAAESVKMLVQRHFAGLFSVYRLFYNIFALVLFVWLLTRLPDTTPANLIVSFPALQIPGLLLLFAGVMVMTRTFRHYDMREFIGLGNRPSSGMLNTSGLNARVRHPLYSGTILAVAGLWCIFPSPDLTAVALAVFLYLPFGIYWEEKKLLRQFGDAYRDYQRRVKRLIPGVW